MKQKIVFLAVVLLVGLPALADQQAAEAQRRAEAIRQAQVDIDEQVEKHGGFEAWNASLGRFRTALQQANFRATREGWSFSSGDRPQLLLETLEGRPAGQCPFAALVHLDRQLKDRGIDLIVVPIPDKTAIHPEYVVQAAGDVPDHGHVAPQVMHFMRKLLEHDVEVIDLYTPYLAHRRSGPRPIYYGAGDTHWRNLGAQIAAEHIAQRLQRYGFVQEAMNRPNPYTFSAHRREDGAKADDVRLIARADGGQYQDVPDSPIILTSDSYGFYNHHLRSHLTAQVAHQIHMPLTIMFREGLWGNMPVELARQEQQSRYLDGRRVIVFTFIARSLTHGSRWPLVDLPQRQ